MLGSVVSMDDYPLGMLADIRLQFQDTNHGQRLWLGRDDNRRGIDTLNKEGGIRTKIDHRSIGPCNIVRSLQECTFSRFELDVILINLR